MKKIRLFLKTDNDYWQELGVIENDITTASIEISGTIFKLPYFLSPPTEVTVKICDYDSLDN